VLGALCSGQLNKQIAYDLDVSEATIQRDWRAARAWLAAELTRGR